MSEQVNPLNNIQRVSGVAQKATAVSKNQGAVNFQDILQGKLTPSVKFSGHAAERLQRRNIVLSPENIQKLNQAVQKAEAKGCRESLILMDDLALIVSIKNHTVITAMDGEHIKENVFTNIDSVVIV